MMHIFLFLSALKTYQYWSLSQNYAMPLFYTGLLAKANPVVFEAYPFETV
jgi:hypothetical protein